MHILAYIYKRVWINIDTISFNFAHVLEYLIVIKIHTTVYLS